MTNATCCWHIKGSAQNLGDNFFPLFLKVLPKLLGFYEKKNNIKLKIDSFEILPLQLPRNYWNDLDFRTIFLRYVSYWWNDRKLLPLSIDHTVHTACSTYPTNILVKIVLLRLPSSVQIESKWNGNGSKRHWKRHV